MFWCPKEVGKIVIKYPFHLKPPQSSTHVKGVQAFVKGEPFRQELSGWRVIQQFWPRNEDQNWPVVGRFISWQSNLLYIALTLIESFILHARAKLRELPDLQWVNWLGQVEGLAYIKQSVRRDAFAWCKNLLKHHAVNCYSLMFVVNRRRFE